MLDVGTNVYVKRLLKDDRPLSFEHSDDFERDAGFIKQKLDNDYFLVEDHIFQRRCIAHKDELIDMSTYKQRYKVGDEVRIRQVREQVKEAFSDIIYPDMYDDKSSRYNGQRARIEHVMKLYPDMYLLEGMPGVWHIMNLAPPYEFVGY